MRRTCFESGTMVLAASLLLSCSARETNENVPKGSGAAPKALHASLEVQTVHWPARDTLDREALGLLSTVARGEVLRAPVPVLAPRHLQLLSASKVIVGEHFAALSTHYDGISLAVHGNRLAHRYSDIRPVAGRVPLRSGKGFVTQNTGIWSASWIEFGVAYSADLECAVPGDARCASETFLLELVDQLAFVGGQEVAP